jgi:hypothetical protein
MKQQTAAIKNLKGACVQELGPRKFDKAKWGEGPWIEEPDAVRWEDEQTGYRCVIERSLMGGHLCGYVGIPSNHPLYGKNWYDEIVRSLQVRRDGVTVAFKPNESHGIQWLGFDCGRVGDYSPVDRELGMNPIQGTTYVEWDEVKQEVENLARQLKQHEQ